MTPALILDTNVVLDWLVFRNPCGAPIEAAIRRGAVRWLVSAPMLAELDAVLAYPQIARWQPDAAGISAMLAAAAQRQPDPPPLAPAAALRCSDPDDQKFIELAAASRARWLLTRDRALLKLARRARRSLDLEILVPERFSGPDNIS